MTGATLHEHVSERDRLVEVVNHLAHLLPSQGPIATFVHHNTLHGLQHLPFDQAIAEGEAFYGAQGYWSAGVMRAQYRAGRITDVDVDAVMADDPDLGRAEVIATVGNQTVTDRDVRRLHLVYGVKATDPQTLRFLVSERDATHSLMDDVAPEAASHALAKARDELTDGVDRVGRDVTLGGWLGELLGLDIPAVVTSVALQDLSAGRGVRGDVSTLLDRLEVPRARHDGYLALVDHALPSAATGADRDRARRSWLAAEARLVDAVARRHLGVRGRFNAVEQAMQSDLAGYAITSLWSACLDAFGFSDPFSPTDPGTLAARDPEGDIDRVGEFFVAVQRGEPHITEPDVHALRADAEAALEADLSRFGREMTHADLLLRLTGTDVTALVNRYMIRLCAAFLDTGQAAWRMPDRTFGFYGAWRASLPHDPTLSIAGVRGWRAAVAGLPDDPTDVIALQLQRLGVDPADHHAYLGRVLAALPGWAGMMNWRGVNPDFPPQKVRPADLFQYLAVRLVVETALVTDGFERLGVETQDVESIRLWLHADPFEHYVRSAVQKGSLPAILARATRDLEGKHGTRDRWATLAHLVWAWNQQSPAGTRVEISDKVWRLFRLAQLSGWSAREVRALSRSARDRIVDVLDSFPEEQHRRVWLHAFERHYRDEILAALAANRGKGRWQVRDRRPKAQMVFCIDEREESMHRAVDEVDPGYETLGAGGFFNMAMNFSGLDDHHVTPLCPAGVVPTNRVKEVPRDDPPSVAAGRTRHERRLWRETAENTYWELKRNAVSGVFLAQLVGLLQSVPLAGRVLTPRAWGEFTERIDDLVIPRPQTELTVDGERFAGLGFALNEQVDRIEAQLRNIGLTSGFARLVVFIGHGSSSLNNPHESAHDCGACGGKHGAPNARAFAALANRSAVRRELAARGIDIPDDTRFVGGIHNTASDRTTFFDTQDIPDTHRVEWETLRRDLDQARSLSARERCRRFDSAPKTASLSRSVRHVEGRARDLSQVRPEWGHCTNAVALVGRRALTQGLFLDRRTFVISYDPREDPDGALVQRILLALGPVGAGINLEYYFSTVDNRVFGCDTKVPHNVTGLMGVMEGAASDLRTGLPKQMIELHEPMRLLLIVESTLEILGRIYTTQPAIAELLDNEWVHLVAANPDDGHFDLFVPGQGFVGWDGQAATLPVVRTSFEYYNGRIGFLPPVRIEADA